MAEEQQTPDQLILIDKWLEITVDKFHQALDEYNIGKLDGELWKSIAGEIVSSGGNVEEVIIKFMQHGRFVDMGVGRGMQMGGRKSLGDAKFLNKRNAGGQLHKYSRQAKPWYSKTKYREVLRLRELLASSGSKIVLGEVEGAIKNGLNIDFSA